MWEWGWDGLQLVSQQRMEKEAEQPGAGLWGNWHLCQLVRPGPHSGGSRSWDGSLTR